MKRSRRIVISTAVTGGVLGVAGVAVAAVPAVSASPTTPAPTSSPAYAAERLALQRALEQIDARTHSLAGDLTVAQRELAAARAAAAARVAAAARANAQRPAANVTHRRWAKPAPSRKVVYVTEPAPTTKPATHTTTGASGSSGGGDDSGGGGNDD